jgi:hypothetical protein
MSKLADKTDTETRTLMTNVMEAVAEYLDAKPAIVALVIVTAEGEVQTFSGMQDPTDEPLIAYLLEKAAARRREQESKLKPITPPH